MKSFPPAIATAIAASLSFTALAAEPDTEAVEYFNLGTNHYFITATAAEANLVDGGAAGLGWVRTGRSFPAWIDGAGAPAGAAGVCRFYSRGANSHFFTANAGECDGLKSLEAAERRDALATGKPVVGWQYEGIAFAIEVPADDACSLGTMPIRRVYNDGFASGEGANHRFVDDESLRGLMLDRAWVGEGVAFCARTKSGGAGFGPPITDFTALVAEWSGIARWKSEVAGLESKFLAPLLLAIGEDGTVTGSGDGCAFTGLVNEGDRFGSHYKGSLSAAGCVKPAFNGEYRKFHLERFSNGTLVVRMKRGDDPEEASIDAVLTAPGTIDLPATIDMITGRWSGTVGWTVTQREGATETLLVTANRPLDLAISPLGELAGEGGGCTFSGPLSLSRPTTFGGRIEASGCSEEAFNGSYFDVTVRRDDGRLRVEFEKESESGGVRLKSEIKGRLSPAGGTVPVRPPVPTTGLAGSYAGPFVARVETRGAGRGNSRTIATSASALSFTLGTDGAFSGNGFGCTFAGSLAISSMPPGRASGTITASGCPEAAHNGVYAAVAKREGASGVELEMERESEAAGVSTKVKISGKAVPSG